MHDEGVLAFLWLDLELHQTALSLAWTRRVGSW